MLALRRPGLRQDWASEHRLLRQVRRAGLLRFAPRPIEIRSRSARSARSVRWVDQERSPGRPGLFRSGGRDTEGEDIDLLSETDLYRTRDVC